MKICLMATLCLLLAVKGIGQIAKSYYYNGMASQSNGAYIEKHPSEDLYFTASTRDLEGTPTTILTKIEPNGQTQWHSEVAHPEFLTAFSGVTDIAINDENIFVSSFQFAGSSANVLITKFDLDGNPVSSITIEHEDGIRRLKSQIGFNEDGKLFTLIKTNSNDVIFQLIDPEPMELITETTVGTSGYNYANVYRSLFCEFDGSNAVIAFNDDEQIKFAKLDATAAVVETFSVPVTDGHLTDFEQSGGNWFLLINKEFGLSTAEENPLHIIEMNDEGSVVSDDTYEVDNPVVFENFSIDNDEIYVCGRQQHATNLGGSLIKISASGIEYERGLPQSNLGEIELHGSDLVSTGLHKDQTTDCSGEANAGGTLFISQKKTSTPNWEVVSPHMVLNMSAIEAFVSASSDNFNDSYNSSPGYTRDGVVSTIFTSNLWTSGQTTPGVVSSCATFNNAYASGPNMLPEAYTNAEKDKWERVWIVSREEIDAHIDAFIVGDPTYQTPEAILNWPGNGDIEKGQSEQLAHYKDINENGVYDPLEGEYPLIKGDYCAFSIYNDRLADNLAPCVFPGDRTNIEVYEYVYGFDCVDDKALNNTTFVYYEVTNLNDEDIFDMYIGNFFDFDIGSSFDDYIETDPLRGIIFGKNSTPGWPEQAYMILGSSTNPDETDNEAGIFTSPNGFGYGNGVIDDERLGMTNAMSDVEILGFAFPESYYNLIRSISPEGLHLKYADTGIDSDFIHPGDSDDLFYSTGGVDPGGPWSEETDGLPSGDRRAMGSSGPFTLFEGKEIYFDMAVVIGVEDGDTGTSSHFELINHVDSVRSYFNNNAVACDKSFDFHEPFDGPYTTIGINESEIASTISLYPNPANTEITLSGIPQNAVITIQSLNGTIVQTFNPTSTIETLDILNLANGIYIVRIANENQNQQIKFVKQ